MIYAHARMMMTVTPTITMSDNKDSNESTADNYKYLTSKDTGIGVQQPFPEESGGGGAKE